MTKKEFVSLLGEQARADMTKTGILASLTTAQGILESGYGTRELAVNANNIFGMKPWYIQSTAKVYCMHCKGRYRLTNLFSNGMFQKMLFIFGRRQKTIFGCTK